MFDEDDAASTALIAFMLGGLAGASLAVIFAPAAGADTRRRLGDGVRVGAGRGRAALDTARRAVTGGTHAAPGNGQEGTDSGRVPEPGLPSTSGPVENPA
jgi:gas vesicle protein